MRSVRILGKRFDVRVKRGLCNDDGSKLRSFSAPDECYILINKALGRTHRAQALFAQVITILNNTLDFNIPLRIVPALSNTLFGVLAANSRWWPPGASLPKWVEVAGRVFDVNVRDDRRDKSYSARISTTLDRIDVRVTNHPEHQAESLLHEVIHAVEFALDLSLHEAQVDHLSIVLFATLRDNPWLIPDRGSV